MASPLTFNVRVEAGVLHGRQGVSLLAKALAFAMVTIATATSTPRMRRLGPGMARKVLFLM
jgi:hypothetical protein